VLDHYVGPSLETNPFGIRDVADHKEGEFTAELDVLTGVLINGAPTQLYVEADDGSGARLIRIEHLTLRCEYAIDATEMPLEKRLFGDAAAEYGTFTLSGNHATFVSVDSTQGSKATLRMRESETGSFRDVELSGPGAGHR
jgi:hypothetical protein